jgi:hypothetical protein
MLRVGWTPSFGGYLEEQVHLLQNQSYADVVAPELFGPPPPYAHYYDFTLRYSRPWKDLTVGAEVDAGRDVFGKSFSRIEGFVRYGGDERTRDDGAEDEETKPSEGPGHGVELFVDAGANANQLKINLEKDLPIESTQSKFGPHLAFGARRAVSGNNDLGARIEVDGDVDGHLLIGARFLDYRYRFGEHFALGAFGGVARYNLATPAYSLYGGLGAQLRNILPKWDIGADFRYAQNVARDHVLADDIHGIRPDSFYKIQSETLYITRRF